MRNPFRGPQFDLLLSFRISIPASRIVTMTVWTVRAFPKQCNVLPDGVSTRVAENECLTGPQTVRDRRTLVKYKALANKSRLLGRYCVQVRQNTTFQVVHRWYGGTVAVVATFMVVL